MLKANDLQKREIAAVLYAQYCAVNILYLILIERIFSILPVCVIVKILCRETARLKILGLCSQHSSSYCSGTAVENPQFHSNGVCTNMNYTIM